MPSLAGLADLASGGKARDPRLVAILEQWWPECYKSEFSGKVIMAPQEAENIEKLFTMFGVPMLVAENSLEVVGHAYDVFCISLESFVSHKLQFPEDPLAAYLDDWPADWVHYIEAVAREDAVEARRLARELQVLAPGCAYPPGVHISKAPRPGQKPT
jgi:hypothetical protein